MNRAAIVLMAFFVAPSQPADGDDDIRALLDMATKKYEQSLSEYRELAFEYFDKREDEARNKGSKKLVDEIKLARAAFESSGELPTTAPATLRARPSSALRSLTAVYKQAIQDYVRKKQDVLAEAAEKELAELQALAGYPSIAGIWQDGPKENGMRVIITQESGRFKASCTYIHKKYGEISWRMNGTISKDGEIKGSLVHTKSPRGWENQTRTGKFSPEDGTIVGRAEFKGGSHDFEWKLVEN